MGYREIYVNRKKQASKTFILLFALFTISPLLHAQIQGMPRDGIVFKAGYSLPILRDPRWNHNLIGTEISISYDKYLDEKIILNAALSYGQHNFHGKYFLNNFRFSEPLIHAQRANTHFGQFRLGTKFISATLDQTYFIAGLGTYFLQMPDISIYFQNGQEHVQGFRRVNPLIYGGIGKEIKILERLSLVVEGNFRYYHRAKPQSRISSMHEFNVLTGVKIFL